MRVPRSFKSLIIAGRHRCREEDLCRRAEDIGKDRRHAHLAKDQEDLEEQEEPAGGLGAAPGVLVVVEGPGAGMELQSSSRRYNVI